MPNDHYIPRLLTAPWEFSQRQLRYFDFSAGRFNTRSSRNLFAKNSHNSSSLETWLNEMIETPAGACVHQLRTHGSVAQPLEWRTARALVLLLSINAQRVFEANHGRTAQMSLEELHHEPESVVDVIAAGLLRQFKMALLPVPQHLFFTEVALFPFPMPDSPVLGLPIALDHVLLAYEGPLSGDALLSNIDRKSLAMFSIGVGRNVNQVVVPPSWRDYSFENAEDAGKRLVEMRAASQKIFNLVGNMSEVAGLRKWVVT